MIQPETEVLQLCHPLLFKRPSIQQQNRLKNTLGSQEAHCKFQTCESIFNQKCIKSSFKHQIQLVISGQWVIQMDPFTKQKISYFECTCEYSFELIHRQSEPKISPQRINHPSLTPIGIRFIFGPRDGRIITLFIKQTQTQKLQQFKKILQTKFIIQRGFYKIYKPIRRLGSGTTSTVYSALNIRDNKNYAIKGFRRVQHKSNSNLDQNTTKSKFQMAFEKEFKIWKDLKHKNIGKLFTVFETDNSTYMVTEELHQTLHTLLTLHGFPTREHIKQILRQLLDGLRYIHSKGIMHRDLKLENIMIRKDKLKEGKLTPVIIDFGLAEYSAQKQFLFHKCGTPGYTAPEILAKTEKQESVNYNEKCDMFSFGIIAYTLICQKFPFHSQKISDVIKLNSQCCLYFDKQLQELIGKDQCDFLSKLLTRDPKMRMSAAQSLNHAYFGSEPQKVWGSTTIDLPI